MACKYVGAAAHSLTDASAASFPSHARRMPVPGFVRSSPGHPPVIMRSCCGVGSWSLYQSWNIFGSFVSPSYRVVALLLGPFIYMYPCPFLSILPAAASVHTLHNWNTSLPVIYVSLPVTVTFPSRSNCIMIVLFRQSYILEPFKGHPSTIYILSIIYQYYIYIQCLYRAIYRDWGACTYPLRLYRV